ncbi:DMT family transporter [Pedobacter aquatilis]|uniref:DMT family transporter n=1 Tax=Pedobacter aquatilis TaxID=351343 RepID=UPI00293166A2|nr:DMT family transporter [Pedobacter aquatilis]
MERKNLLLLLLIFGTAFWGISFSVTKLAIGSESPSTFLFYRFFLATIVLSVVFWKHLIKTQLSDVKTGVILAIPLFFGIHLQTLGIKTSPASQCAFIAGMTVVIVPILKLLFYRKATALKIWVAALFALAGLFVISLNGQLKIGNGDLYTLSGAVAFALYLIAVEKQASLKNLVPTIIPMFATCMVFTFFVALNDAKAEWMPQTNTFWMGIVFCALFSTAYMYSISNIAQKYISAERVAIIYLFEPVFGAIAAFFILDENLSIRLLIGGGLIFLATIISEANFKRLVKVSR